MTTLMNFTWQLSWISHDHSHEFHMTILMNFTWARLASNFSHEFHMSSPCEQLLSRISHDHSWISHDRFYNFYNFSFYKNFIITLMNFTLSLSSISHDHSHEFHMITLMNFTWSLSWISHDQCHEFHMTTHEFQMTAFIIFIISVFIKIL